MRDGVLVVVVLAFGCAQSIRAQNEPQVTVLHRIEGRIQFKTDGVGHLRVRLVREMRPIAETFTRPEGDFAFTQVREGDYSIETFDTEKFEASWTSVSARPLIRQRPEIFRVFVELQLKPPPGRLVLGVVAADVDLNVPKAAVKHYRAAMKALDHGDGTTAITELQLAVKLYDHYYAARLELGQALRKEKRYEEAAQVLRPLAQIAPRRVEPRIANGAALLSLGHRDAAVEELRVALILDDANWEAHFYMGWALLEDAADKAEPHLKRALELDDRKAVRAHLALARLAHSQGKTELAIKHLNDFLTLAPDSEDAESARRLAENLRSPR
ncbi:MAG: tetratricopeptide repeat protein [Acidobacteriota bacterium]